MATAASNEQPELDKHHGHSVFVTHGQQGLGSDSPSSNNEYFIGELNGLPLYHAGGHEALAIKVAPSPEEKPSTETTPQPENNQGDNSEQLPRGGWSTMYICVGVAFIVYIGLMAGQAVWIYFYVKTSLHPDPDRFITSTFTRWKFYIIFMYLFGGAYTILNLSLWGSLAMSVLCKCDFRARCGSILNPLFCVFFPLFAGCMIAFPAFGPLIPPLQRRAFVHECDSWGAQVLLDARSYKDPGYIANTAVFTTSRDNSPMFSFDLTNQTDPLFASFHIRQFNAPESALSSSLVPAVRSITYDFVRQSFNGTCATSKGSDTPCLNGSFDLARLAVNLNYTLPGRSHLETRSRSELPDWNVYGGLPTLILRTLGLDDKFGNPVLKTATTAVWDCTRLKVCLAGLSDPNANGPVGPDTLVPLGLMLTTHTKYSLECTKPAKTGKSKH